ncbi:MULTISPECIES: TetR/AcrR family transcriptional regulator [unclassified Novosphingobium]|uniref:TetR/AcrR family transcriptional regulator n=1 Tax=unclassified Novosphingobium TaxID=2644732 RepID=UPI0025CBD8A5|nr:MULTISPECIES: TetR/AcrR family transcriptional regulator [unclassified Novosphingobium]HQV03952.1 TetR/AcrR family transcriptional regulator [Novosphingobium sp.]
MTRKKLPADVRRAATVEAVIALAAATNPADITTAQIAAFMGVTQGALFRHFSDKEAVWLAVMDWTSDTLLARIDGVAGATPKDRLQAIFAAHVEFVVEHVGVPRILFGELQRDADAPGKVRVRALMSGYRSRVLGLLELAKAQGQIDEKADCAAAATMFLGMVQGLVMQAMAADDFTTMPATSARLFEVFLDGLRGAK